MPTPTYDLIASATPASGASTVDFTNLGTVAASYRDLVLVANMTGKSFAQIQIRVNNSSSNQYSWIRMSGNAISAESDSAGPLDSWSISSFSLDTNQLGLITLHLFDFSQTNKNKHALARTEFVGRQVTDARTLRWDSTSAITSIQVFYQSNTYPAGCTLDLYGIAG